MIAPMHLDIPEQHTALKPSIVVFGVGGAGGNAVQNMISSGLQGARFIVANTDAQALENSIADRKIRLGEQLTRGLGAGAAPEVGRAAAEESMEVIKHELQGVHMLFIAAGMGGGTGTGAAPVIARIARDAGILVVGVVTKPFHFEGAHRMRLADAGLGEMQQHVDTLIVIPNQNLFRIANERTTFADAFRLADDVLHAGVRSITDLITMPGLINLDFADIVSVMGKMGKAMMGTGEASGEQRALRAAEAAIANPLLDHSSMKGAKGVLINITGGPDMTLFEVDEAANRIREEVDGEANIIFGSTFHPTMDGLLRVSVVATGIDEDMPDRRRTTFPSAVAQPNTKSSVHPASPLARLLPEESQEPVRQSQEMRPESKQDASPKVYNTPTGFPPKQTPVPLRVTAPLTAPHEGPTRSSTSSNPYLSGTASRGAPASADQEDSSSGFGHESVVRHGTDGMAVEAERYETEHGFQESKSFKPPLSADSRDEKEPHALTAKRPLPSRSSPEVKQGSSLSGFFEKMAASIRRQPPSLPPEKSLVSSEGDDASHVELPAFLRRKNKPQ